MEEKGDEETKRQISDQKRCISSIKIVDIQAILNSKKNVEERIKARKNNQY